VKTTTYQCDLCRAELDGPDPAVIFEFSGDHTFREGPRHQVERHLCEPCACGMLRMLIFLDDVLGRRARAEDRPVRRPSP
jgi:hypothetical protein